MASGLPTGRARVCRPLNATVPIPAKVVKANRSGTVTEDAVLAGKARFTEESRRSDTDGVPDQVKGATISLVGTPVEGYIPMSAVPVIRCGEFVTSKLAQPQAERCKC